MHNSAVENTPLQSKHQQHSAEAGGAECLMDVLSILSIPLLYLIQEHLCNLAEGSTSRKVAQSLPLGHDGR